MTKSVLKKASLLMLCFVVPVLMRAPSALAQDAAASQRALRVTRTAYENQMENLRADVRRILARKLDEARQLPDGEEAAEMVREAEMGFAQDGELPADPRQARWQKHYDEIVTDLMRAYLRTIAVHEAAGMADAAERLEEELDIFRASWDMAPWRENLLEGEPTLIEADASRAIEAFLPDAYRLEVRARGVANGGVLELLAPLGEGPSVRVRAMPDAAGEVHLLMTLTGERATVDLGDTDGLEYIEETGSSENGLLFRSSGSALELASVKVKPLGLVEARELPDGAKAATPRERERTTRAGRAPKAEKPSLFQRIPVNTNWRAVRTVAGRPPEEFIVRVVRKTDTMVYLHADVPGAGGVEYGFRGSGQTLQFVAIRPTGSKGGVLHNPEGTLRMRDDQLIFRYKYRYTAGNLRNRKVEGEIVMRRD